MVSWLIPLLLGFIMGILSAWGVGGGTLLLLLMTLVMGVDQQTAQGINLLYFLPTAAGSLISHSKNGLIQADVLRCSALWGTAAAAAGALLATTADTAVLRRPFGVYLLLAGLLTLRGKRGETGGKSLHGQRHFY